MWEGTTMTEKTSNGADPDPSVVDRAADLSVTVLTSVEGAQHAALSVVRRFLETVDEVLPGEPSRREAVVDSTMDLADTLVTTQYQFLRTFVRTAGGTLRTASPA